VAAKRLRAWFRTTLGAGRGCGLSSSLHRTLEDSGPWDWLVCHQKVLQFVSIIIRKCYSTLYHVVTRIISWIHRRTGLKCLRILNMYLLSESGIEKKMIENRHSLIMQKKCNKIKAGWVVNGKTKSHFIFISTGFSSLSKTTEKRQEKVKLPRYVMQAPRWRGSIVPIHSWPPH
jgi:hypothetical protein